MELDAARRAHRAKKPGTITSEAAWRPVNDDPRAIAIAVQASASLGVVVRDENADALRLTDRPATYAVIECQGSDAPQVIHIQGRIPLDSVVARLCPGRGIEVHASH